MQYCQSRSLQVHCFWQVVHEDASADPEGHAPQFLVSHFAMARGSQVR